MNAWGNHVSTRPGVIGLAELSLLVADRNRFEAAGVPTVSALAVGKPGPSGRRARRHTLDIAGDHLGRRSHRSVYVETRGNQ